MDFHDFGKGQAMRAKLGLAERNRLCEPNVFFCADAMPGPLNFLGFAPQAL